MKSPSICRSTSRVILMSALLMTLPACGTSSTGTTEYRADGTVAFRCRASLPTCLERADEACHGARYEVLHAADDRDYYGPADVAQRELRSSEAVIRCGQRGWSLLGGGASRSATSPAGAGAPPLPEARACVPGVTQVCVGPGACHGGQACLADGSGFGACACAAPATPPAADAGAIESP